MTEEEKHKPSTHPASLAGCLYGYKNEIKKVFEKTGKSVREVVKTTSIDRKYLGELAKNEIPADEILLDGMIILALTWI